eukprot:g35408.t1
MGSKEMVEELNRYFASVFTVENTSNIAERQEIQEAGVSVVAITKEKMLGNLKGVKIEKSSRPDGFVSTVVQWLALVPHSVTKLGLILALGDYVEFLDT